MFVLALHTRLVRRRMLASFRAGWFALFMFEEGFNVGSSDTRCRVSQQCSVIPRRASVCRPRVGPARLVVATQDILVATPSFEIFIHGKLFRLPRFGIALAVGFRGCGDEVVPGEKVGDDAYTNEHG